MADAHLGNRHHQGQAQASRQLYSFWRSIARPGNTLFILGDLFDFWFEWPQAVPERHYQTLRELRNLVSAGVEVHLLPGNHDFHFGSFLPREVGLQLHPEPYEFEWEGKRFHVRHGDGLDPGKTGYHLLRRVLRNPLSIALFRLLPPVAGMWLADTVSGISSQRSLSSDTVGFDPMERYSKTKIAAGADYVVMGHLHIPHQSGTSESGWLVLGDWIRQFSYAQYDEGGLQLKEFRDNEGDR
ncbi:UDP-2,3-diacylglucosamine diphosphatase [bacterium]|nr:UDP-2,3-diacylglucosamine diphosphatase [bacterium]